MRVGAEGAGERDDKLDEDGERERADELGDEGVQLVELEEGGDCAGAARHVGQEVEEAMAEGDRGGGAECGCCCR